MTTATAALDDVLRALQREQFCGDDDEKGKDDKCDDNGDGDGDRDQARAKLVWRLHACLDALVAALGPDVALLALREESAVESADESPASEYPAVSHWSSSISPLSSPLLGLVCACLRRDGASTTVRAAFELLLAFPALARTLLESSAELFDALCRLSHSQYDNEDGSSMTLTGGLAARVLAATCGVVVASHPEAAGTACIDAITTASSSLPSTTPTLFASSSASSSSPMARAQQQCSERQHAALVHLTALARVSAGVFSRLTLRSHTDLERLFVAFTHWLRVDRDANQDTAGDDNVDGTDSSADGSADDDNRALMLGRDRSEAVRADVCRALAAFVRSDACTRGALLCSPSGIMDAVERMLLADTEHNDGGSGDIGISGSHGGSGDGRNGACQSSAYHSAAAQACHLWVVLAADVPPAVCRALCARIIDFSEDKSDDQEKHRSLHTTLFCLVILTSYTHGCESLWRCLSAADADSDTDTAASIPDADALLRALNAIARRCVSKICSALACQVLAQLLAAPEPETIGALVAAVANDSPASSAPNALFALRALCKARFDDECAFVRAAEQHSLVATLIRVVDRAASARDAVADLAAWQCLVALVDSDSYALDAHLSILSDAMRACIVRFEICTSADVCKALMTVLERVGDATSTAAVIEPVLNACWHQLETAHGSFCAFEAAVAIVAAVAKQKSYRMLLVANADAMLIALEAAIAALPLHTRPFATRRVFGILASAAVSPPLPLSYTIESAVCDGAGDGDINATTSLATAVYFQAAGALVAQCPGNLAFVRRQSRAVAAAIGCLVSHRVYAAPVRASAARLLRALDHPIASAVVAELAQRLMVVAATSSEAEPCISIEYLEVVWHLAQTPTNGRVIYEQCAALQACVASLFDVPPAAFAVNVQLRCMLIELLRCTADADVGVNMSLCANRKLCDFLEVYERALNADCDSSPSSTPHERCAKQVCATLSKVLRCDHVELFRWIGAALVAPAAGLADKELALALLSTSVEDENVRARLLARLPETQIVAGLWTVVCTPLAYGTLQVAACKVLNTLKQRVTVDMVRALTTQIARIGEQKSGRSHAIKAALELCEWTDNVAAMEEIILDHSALVAACRSASRADDRVDACKLMQTLSCWPGDDVLDSLAGATGIEQSDALRCVAQLARNVEFRPRMAHPSRKVVATLLHTIQCAPGRLAVGASHALSSFCSHVRFAVRPALLEPDLNLVAILSSTVVAAAGAYDCNAVRKSCCLVLGRLGACVDRSVLVALLASVGADSGRARENSVQALTYLAESTAVARVMATDSSLGLSAALEDAITSHVHEQDAAVAACKLLATRALSLVPTRACVSKLAAMLRAAAGADRVALMSRVAELATDALRRTVSQDTAGLATALHSVIMDESGEDSTVRVKACEILRKLDVPFPAFIVEHLLRDVFAGARTQHLEAHATNALACVSQIAEQNCNHQLLLEPQHALIALLLECLGESKSLALRRIALAVLRQLCHDVDLQVSAPPALKDEILSLAIQLMSDDGILPNFCRWYYIDLLTCLQLKADTAVVARWIAHLRSNPTYLSAKRVVADIVHLLSTQSRTTWALKNDATLSLVHALESTIGEAAAYGDVQELACKALGLLKRPVSANVLTDLVSIIAGSDGVRRYAALRSLLMLCELEANIVAIPNSIHVSLLERWVVEQNNGQCCKRIVCSIVQKTKYVPADAILDALAADIASAGGQRRLCALDCLNRLAAQEKLRASLVESARGLLPTIIAVISSALGAARCAASQTIAWLSETSTLKPLLLQPEFGLVRVLGETIICTDGFIANDHDSRYWASYALWKLGSAVEHLVLAPLVTAMTAEGAFADKCILQSVVFLARIHDHHAPLVDSALGLCAALERMLARKCIQYEAIGLIAGLIKLEPSVAMLCSLQDVCRTESGAARQKAMETLQKFAQLDTNRRTMQCVDSGCREAMHAVVRDASPRNVNRAAACKLLSTLDLAPDEATMCAIMSYVSSADALIQRSGLSCIANLAASHTIKMSVLSNPLVSDTLQRVAKESQGSTLTLACECIGLTSVVVKPELVEALSAKIACDSTVVALNAIRSLSSLLQTKTIAKSMSTGKARLLDCLQGCLHSKFERDEFGEACNLLVETMGKLGALPSLVNLSRVVKCLSDGSAAIKEIGITLINQLVNGYVRFRHTLNIGSDQFGVIAALVRIAQDKATGLVGRTWQCLMNIAKDRESIKGMLAAGVHSEALRHLAETYGDALLMRKQASGTYLYGFTLVTLMNMLQWPEARDAIKAAGAVDFFKTCFEHDSLMGLYCAVIMAFLVGNDESGNSAGLLQSSPSTLERIADCLANTTNRVGGDGYNYGIFSLGLIASAVQNVCINDSNKRYFATPRVLKILTQILDDFSSNKESGNVGGGGDDVESAQTSVEILLLLSFVFEDDAELRGFMSAETGVLAALRSFYQVIGEYKTSADAQQTCGLLLKRLTPPPVFLPFESSSTRAQASLATDDCVSQQLPSTVEEQVSAQPTHAKHIMVSYCWQDKPNVIKLCAALRGRGHDVWRDEDGSSVLEGMGGATQDRMAEAVELSSHVIVCVSRIYKERPNCRFEAQYANKLSLRKRLRIVYVMMDEEYSSEVDGWLGFMMSDELWYKCWSDEGIQQSADTLSNRVFGAMQQPTVAPPIAPVHAASLPEPVSRPCSSDASATAASSRSVPASNGGQLVSLSSPLGPAMQAASASTPLAAAPNLKMSFVSPSPSSSFSPCASGHVELTPMSHVAATGSTPTSASLRRVSPAQSWTNAQLTASSSVAAVHPLALQNLLDEVGCTWTEDADEPEAVRAGLAAAKRRAYRLSLAWEVLCHAFNARNASDVASRLCEWGLERPAHLAFLAAEDISLLAAMLKLVPRKMFLDLVSPHSQV